MNREVSILNPSSRGQANVCFGKGDGSWITSQQTCTKCCTKCCTATTLIKILSSLCTLESHRKNGANSVPSPRNIWRCCCYICCYWYRCAASMQPRKWGLFHPGTLLFIFQNCYQSRQHFAWVRLHVFLHVRPESQLKHSNTPNYQQT